VGLLMSMDIAMEINWIVVFIRIADGFLYATGFILGLLLWLVFLSWLRGRNKIEQQRSKEFFDQVSK